MDKKEILEDVKRHLDYVNETNQKSIRDTEMEVMYQEIERLNNIINELENFLTNKLMSIPCEVFEEEKLEIERQTKVACYQVALGKLLKLKQIKGDDKE